ASLAALQARDRDFSAVLFEDFVYALYARVQAARSDPQAMAALAPYVDDKARAALLVRSPAGVKIHGVIIGKLQVIDVNLTDRARVHLLISANYTAELEHGPQGYYIEERWVLERDLNVTSKPPVDVHSFQCPSCGGPYERGDQGRCSRCAQVVEGGRFDWSLRSLRVLNQSPTPPTLTGDVEEQGTHLPTVLAANIDRQFASFAASDPGASAEAIDRRLREIYAALNTAWTTRDLRPVRPHVSDALYNYLSYWIDAYRAQGLQNVLAHMNISRTKIARLTRDHYYDAITVRIWARGTDYTIRVADGHRVAGDPQRPRAYSEYWTLIRGAKVRGAPRTPGQCPNCGAPLDRVNMAGNCEACGTHLTRGEFDWVLSKIEQD
ncbi:MAG: TIM44-like domain-containing protein, partial [Myxococcales bacterium]|nr:TIM44-like domain-containing protein [Myxococcales bacterium]